jgi:hypothetical protein
MNYHVMLMQGRHSGLHANVQKMVYFGRLGTMPSRIHKNAVKEMHELHAPGLSLQLCGHGWFTSWCRALAMVPLYHGQARPQPLASCPLAGGASVAKMPSLCSLLLPKYCMT